MLSIDSPWDQTRVDWDPIHSSPQDVTALKKTNLTRHNLYGFGVVIYFIVIMVFLTNIDIFFLLSEGVLVFLTNK